MVLCLCVCLFEFVFVRLCLFVCARVRAYVIFKQAMHKNVI